MKENWGLQAADLAQERNVFVQKYGLPVRTSLTRADEIEYALETQLLGKPKEHFFAMQDLQEPAEDVAQKAVKSVAKSALHSAVPGSMAARWLSKTPFFRGFWATGVSLSRQTGAAVLKDNALAATAMGLGADTQTQRTQEIKQKLQEKGLPAALLPLEKLKADAQAIGQSITLKNWLEPNFAQEKLKALHKEQQKVDLFNQKVRILTEHFLQRTGLERNEKDGFWYDLGSGAASVLGSIGALVLTRNPYVGAVIFGAAEGQGSYEAAVEAGIAPQDAYWLGKANGAWIGATELIGDKFFSKLLYGKGILGKYSKAILEKTKQSPKALQAIAVATTTTAEGGFIEAAQETTQNVGTDLIHKYSGVEDKKTGQIIKDALYAGLLAFVLGGLPGGVVGLGQFRKYTENIKDELAAAGVEEKEAENLARETALTAIGSEFVGDSIKAVSAEINSPLTAEDRNPAEFARVMTQAQSREIDQTAWKVAEKVEQESLQAGVSPKVAAATGQVAQALTNGIYRLTKLTPKEQAHFNISILKGAQNRQVPAFNQAAAAMYRNKRNVAEFVDFVKKGKATHPTYLGHTTAQGNYITMAADVVESSSLEKEDYKKVFDNIDHILFTEPKKQYAQQKGYVLLGSFSLGENSYGISCEIFENREVKVTKVFKKEKSVVENWIKQKAAGTQPLYSPLKTWLDKQALAGRLGNSISGRLNNSIGKIDQEIKHGKSTKEIISAPVYKTFEKEWQEGNRLQAVENYAKSLLSEFGFSYKQTNQSKKSESRYVLFNVGNEISTLRISAHKDPDKQAARFSVDFNDNPEKIAQNIDLFFHNPLADLTKVATYFQSGFHGSPHRLQFGELPKIKKSSRNPKADVAILPEFQSILNEEIQPVKLTETYSDDVLFTQGADFREYLHANLEEIEGRFYVSSGTFKALVSNSDVNKMLNTSNNFSSNEFKKMNRYFVLQLKNLLPNSILAKKYADLNGNTGLFIQRRFVPVEYNNNLYIVKLTLKESSKRRKDFSETIYEENGKKDYGEYNLEIVKKVTLEHVARTLEKRVQPTQGSKNSIDNNSQIVKGITWTQALEGVADNSGAYLPDVKVYTQNPTNPRGMVEIDDEKAPTKIPGEPGHKGLIYSVGDLELFVKERIAKYNKNYSKNKSQTYTQNPTNPRGMVEIDEQAHEAVIRIFENADPSTIVHELAHIYLTMLHESAKVSMDEDFQKLMEDIDAWLGEPQGADGSYSVEQQEQFARGFESYLAQGKAPNKDLENVFEKFAAWLAEIYESVKDFLQISPEVSSIFDRLLTTQEPIKRSKIGQKVQAAKELAQAMKKGFGQDIDGVSVADMKELLRTLSTRKPPEPKEHLLKDLRKYGADYANAALVDKEAYKNARVFDKKGGVGDNAAQWLMDKGYLSEQDAQSYQDQSDLDQAAADMIERALGGEKIYKLHDRARAEERAAYEENLNTLLEIFPDIPTAKESLRAIALLESQGYRAVEKKDLQDLERMLNMLGKMTERLEQEELKAQAGALERKALKIQEDAKRIKKRVLEELDKRQIAHKQNMQNLLKNAQTPQEIYAAAEGVLEQLEKLWQQTQEAKQEKRQLEVPTTNWAQIQVKLLADFTRISQGAHQEVAEAQKTLASFFGRILSEEEAKQKEKAEAVLKKADLESKYVRAMQRAMSGVVHISTADIAKYTAFLARSTQRHRLLTKRNVEQFIERAREIQLRNYKKYMTGKLTALFNRKIFEKAGTAKRLKYNEWAARFLTEAGKIWNATQAQAQAEYAARFKTLDRNNPPDGFTALSNAVLSLKAEPDMAGAQDYYDVYQTALSAIRGDGLQKRMEVLRRIVQEQTLRVALIANLQERKLGKTQTAYILRGGVDLQTYLSMVFGKGTFDKYEENGPIRQVDLSLQDWQNPTKDFILSPIDESIAQQIGVQNKPVLLKRNIIEKNKLHHKDLSIEEYNDILNRGLYTPVLVLKTNPTEKPNYFNFIFTTEDKNDNVVIEISAQKENAEIVSFYRIDKEKLDKKIERTNRNGGLSVKTLTRGPSPIRTPSVGSINSIADIDRNFKSEQYRQVLRALEKIINGSEEETIKNLRPDFEQYGGTPDVTLVFGDNKKGLQHIAQKHGADILPKVLQAVINGRVEKFTPNKKTLHIKQENIVAVLSLDENGKQKSWLLTGWDETSEIGKEKRTGANGQVSTDSAATQTLPTFSRQDLGAVLKSINSIADIDRNFKAQQYEIDFREELSPENEQMQAAVFKHQSRQKLVAAAMKAYGLNSADQVIDKMTELQNDKMQIVSYADVKDEQSGEMTAHVYKNGKVYTDSGAKQQTITREEILTFWLWDQDHVFDENGQDYGLSGRLTRAYGRAQLEQMFAKLTPQDKAFGTALQDLLAQVHQLESQTHRRIYGFALPHKEHYFPSVTDRNDDSIDYKQQIVDNAKAPSFIKERVKSERPKQQRISPVKLVLRHLDRAGEFIFEAEKYAKLRRVVNNTALKNAFENKFGETDGKILYKKLQDLVVQQGPAPLKTKDELFDLTEKAFNGWVKAALGAKIMVGVKQFASSISFAEQMPAAQWIKWFAEGLSRPLKTAQYMKELSPYIQVRYESGGVNEAVARAMVQEEIRPIATRWNNLTNLLLLNTRMGDKASLIYGGYPYVKYLTEVKGLTQEQAAREFEKQAVRTLQSSLKANLSMAQAQADSLPWRLFLTFKNQQMQYVRRVADSYTQYQNKEISLRQFGKTALIYVVLNPLVYTLLSLGYLADDDDERQKDYLRIAAAPMSQFFDAWPFYGAAAEYLLQAAWQCVQGEELPAPQRIGTPAIDDFYRDVLRAVKAVNDDDVEATEFMTAFMEFAKYFGLPLGTFGNIAGGVKDITQGEVTRGSLRVAGFSKKRAEKITGTEE